MTEKANNSDAAVWSYERKQQDKERAREYELKIICKDEMRCKMIKGSLATGKVYYYFDLLLSHVGYSLCISVQSAIWAVEWVDLQNGKGHNH